MAGRVSLSAQARHHGAHTPAFSAHAMKKIRGNISADIAIFVQNYTPPT